MSFLDRRGLSIVIIILIMIVVGFAIGFGGFFCWHKIYISINNSSENIFQEEIKTKCLEDVAKMTDQELINETIFLFEENKLDSAVDAMIKYLNCKLVNNEDEQLYNISKIFIKGLMIKEEGKEKYLRLLDEAYFGESRNTFIIQLALGDLSEICPTRLQELCIKNYQGKNTKEIVCHDYCKLIDDYQTDDDRFNREIMDYSYWRQHSLFSTLVTDVTSNRVTVRLAIVLQLKGQDMAKQFCQSLPETRLADIESTIRGFCFEKLDTILEKKPASCEKLREEVFKLICTILE